MARALVLTLVACTSGCTWTWDAFVIAGADAGPRADGGARDAGALDGAPRDAGALDAGACEDDPLLTTCGAGEICTRPGMVRTDCCEVGRCLLHEGRVRGQALRSAVILGNPDGSTLEPEWEATPRYSFDTVRTAGASAPQAGDFAGSFRVLWDDNQMHVFIEGQDDVIETGMGLGTWEQVDSVEIRFDASPAVPVPDLTVDPDEAHFVMRVWPQTVLHLGPVPWVQTFTRGSIDEAAGTWIMEISIYWLESGFRLASPGDLVGLEILVHDVDDWDGPVDTWSFSPCTRVEPPKHVGLIELVERVEPRTRECEQTCPSSGLCAPAEYACSGAPLHCPP